MTTRDQATPRPWKVDDSKPKQLAVIMDDSDGEGICEMEYRQGEGKANAALIVSAVNQHDALVAALDSVNDMIDDAVNNKIRNGKMPPVGHLLSMIQDTVQAALSGGKGE